MDELRAIFNLFEGGAQEEMDIRQVNQVMRQIEELNGKNSPECVQRGELKLFPNKQQTLGFPDFCSLYSSALGNKELQEHLLQDVFHAFDFNNQGYITSQQIKHIFEIFKDKTSSEDIQSISSSPF